ncbi:MULTISPECIES: LLM class flavin-dependent oxidoreductase [unclassified Burkholderia]|uniref:LLM class flavin-dependent oxidoreductase n=1 Tax=unclassified Burkholderia TaxID=2613784 RepID=UPI000F5995DC|nr:MULTISPECIES: LLM class flavin-dependent oxidoreductase [unclassified Burkholderia]RQS19118.1 LLM class flavin-dependent oxidoreductase [Burkholderia sp. Bp8995]RQS38879.1 LLM class flavin-dependent oxidoreductase [Burkholderia sp. Bp8989]
MEFGIFLPNGSNGYILSEGSPVYTPTFEHNVAIAQEAERYGLDFLISMIKFRGFGGTTGYWDECLESFTLSAALAASTKKIRMFASSGIPSLHPAVAARMIATLDDISNGRCGLNIVTGWNRPEYEQMGLWPSENYHAGRYDYAAEYVEVVRSLWANENVNYKSDNFSLTDCSCLPKPKHDIKVVCAGQSPKGIQFTAQYGDYNFVFAPPNRLKTMTGAMQAEAAKHNRKVGTLACFTLIAADTDEEAFDLTQTIIDKADVGAIGNMINSANMDSNRGGTSDNLRDALKQTAFEGNMAYMSIPVIAGSYENVAKQIDEIAETTGIAGMLWTFPDFLAGVRDFGEKIMPRLLCANGPRAQQTA